MRVNPDIYMPDVSVGSSDPHTTITNKPRRPAAAEVPILVAVVLGTVALAARAPGWGAMLVVAIVGVIGVIAPIDQPDHPRSWPVWLFATGMGAGAMLAVGRMGLPLGATPAFGAVVASAAAAVAEEAFFRRLLYGWLARFSAVFAAAASAAVFAAVHIPLYGWSSLPLNLVAGLLLAWQRWFTGGWSAPAVTHLTANLVGIGVIG